VYDPTSAILHLTLLVDLTPSSTTKLEIGSTPRENAENERERSNEKENSQLKVSSYD